MILKYFTFCIYLTIVYAGISPVHEMRERMNAKMPQGKLLLNSPYKVMKHLDDSLSRATKNVTDNPEMEQTLYQIAKDLVSSILSKIESQDKITRMTREALDASGKNKGVTAIETRRILDYISRTLSGHILSITRASTEPELHRLVYGLAVIAAEVSIVSGLKDITYATALSKKQSIDLSLRRKRFIDFDADYGPYDVDVGEHRREERSIVGIPKKTINTSTSAPFKTSTIIYNAVLNKTIVPTKPMPTTTEFVKSKPRPLIPASFLKTPFSVIPHQVKTSMVVLNNKEIDPMETKGFLNQTALEYENLSRQAANDAQAIVMQGTINSSNYERVEPTLDTQELSAPGLIDEWLGPKDNLFKPAKVPEAMAEMEIDRTEMEDEVANQKKMQEKLEKLELKAKKAILYAGDVAYLTAASVIAMRRALTASIEVQMSVRYAKNGMSNHQELMMNLAKTAAQQAGKEAKSATSKSLACDRVIKLALKYTAQSHGAKLNHVANRIIMDSLSLATLAKSMAFVSSDIAINSLYQATDVRPPVK